MLLLVDGFDLYNAKDDLIRRKWVATSNATRWDNNNGRYGGGGMKGDGNTGAVCCAANLPVIGQGVTESLFLSTASMFGAVLDGASDRVIQAATDVWDSNTQHAHIRVCLHPSITGAIQVRRETTVIDSSAGGVLVANQWHRIETEIRLHATTGWVKVRVDGVQVVNFSGNTISGARTTASIGAVFFGQYGGTEGNSRLDDVMVWNGAGAAPNASLDDFAISTLLPTGDGGVITGTQNTGPTVWQAVDEAGIGDDGTTYVTNNTLNNVDVFAFNDVTLNGAVYAAVVNVMARAGDPGLRKIQLAVRVGSTVYPSGTDIDIPSQATYVGRNQFFPVNPATSAAWTLSEINAAQAGYKLTS